MRQYTSKYDDLLKQAKGSAKIWIPQLCQALREENSNLSNEDIRDRVMKDCISIWQRGTINDAFPQELKNPERVESGKRARQKQLARSGNTNTVLENPENFRGKNDSDSNSKQQQQYGAVGDIEVLI